MYLGLISLVLACFKVHEYNVVKPTCVHSKSNQLFLLKTCYNEHNAMSKESTFSTHLTNTSVAKVELAMIRT